MDRDIENQIKELNLKLRNVFEEQGRNQFVIQTQEHVERNFYEWKNRSNRLFNRILETWHRDKELSYFFMNMRQEAQHIERKLTFELENQKETLFKEKRDLRDLENDFSYEKQKLVKETNS
ncbi:hypothetical protein BKK39_03660 [Bacillus cereus]|uniref:DUF3958 domain-containing protein n=1 Tax=Bacillus paranthracis TaxID=2026186 RepID=A0A9X8SE52_9BACI|nr:MULTISPECIES: DUF3958 family protein [Bacillus cereus group]ONG79369.1 hypothetical protein BKK41_20675 [Bacillus cereus]MDA1986246.1 DUF3958 family protein [Bacillus cereus group sp. BcHK104]MDA2238584.1 DUF3958 family protein [Bacillus cereus group sp. Bc222]MDA2584024.1 DUF3958 family protein [Bacillus cereus group sp. Bc062]MDX6044465.1 DUF3958 family protein [Bacillus paranthracis]